MANTPPRLESVSEPPTPTTPVPKSYAQGVAQTPDPWELCTTLAWGGDRSAAWSVQQQVTQTLPAGWPKLEEKLLAALASPACTEVSRAFLCEMLALVGTAKSVPTLVSLLREPKTAEAARYALDAIPGPETDAALRDALAHLKDEAKAGLIGSIATRQDPAARAALLPLKDHPAESAVVRDAATRALESLEVP